MKTLEASFTLFIATVFKGQTLPPAQLEDLKAAFYGGALITFELITAASAKPEAVAMAFCDEMQKEAKEYALSKKMQWMGLKPS